MHITPSEAHLTDQEITVADSLASVSREEWDSLAGDNPTVAHDFLETLHVTGCASRQTGWLPQYLLLRRDGVLQAAMLLYVKNHSRGEYVFDHSWAEAFHRHGIAYYPKLLSAVPFSPVTGPRLLARTHGDRVLLLGVAVEIARRFECSSLHILFPGEDDLAALKEAGFMLREGVQFHWENDNYTDFDAFLASMRHEKRKKLRQDRRRVADAGVTFRHLRGEQIDADALRFFYECYVSTYEAHFSKPYLTFQFFEKILASMPSNILIVLAEQGGEPVAAALNLIGGDVMYGRYWGCRRFISGLHFETCYVQSLEYCIANGLSKFEGGAQGVHKMSRGLVPTATWSAHWIADQRFADAIGDFLREETEAMDRYIDELAEHTPFKQGATPG